MPKTTKLDLPILLPGAPDASDACVGRLITILRDEPGVSEAHIVEKDTPPRLCIHYDPDQLTLGQVRRLARQAGAGISGRYGHLVGWLEGVRHARHARTIEAVLSDHPGLMEAAVDASGAIRLEFDREQIDRAGIDRMLAEQNLRFSDTLSSRPSGQPEDGSHGAPHTHDHTDGHDHGHGPNDGHDHAHGGFLGPNTELIFALASGVALAMGFAIERLVAGVPGWLPLALYIAAYGFGGFFTVGEAVENLRRKRFEIDTLMLVAAAGAAALGAWAEGALLLFLFSLGHALEHYAMGRAKRAIEALAELAPRTAHVRRDGQVVEVPVEDLGVGEIVIVRPNERLPADGFVVAGSTSINQAPVTGESMPVDKQPVADPLEARARPASVGAAGVVFAGTINGAGAIEIETTRKSTDTTLAKVVRMVSEAETQKSPTQRFTERFE